MKCKIPLSSEFFLKTLITNDVSSQLPDLLLKPFLWLNSNLKESGSLFDQGTGSYLDHQYHLSWFILSASIMNFLYNNNQYDYKIKISLQYLSDIGYEVNQNVNSFNGIPLIFSMCFIEDENLKTQISKYVSGIDFIPLYGSQKANNFHCLKMTALLLKNKIMGGALDSNDLKFINNIAYTKLPEWQYDDGIFYDKQYTQEKYKGIPHLTYHATITMLTILSSIFLQDERLFRQGEKGLIALEGLVSPSGEFGYGRSNNAIFGYSSTIFAVSLYHLFSSDNNFRNLHCILLKQLHNNISKDGHIYIVPNKYEKLRAGFDKYMFVTVYESWALGLLLLSHIIFPIEYNER